jgi:hypothetical protein
LLGALAASPALAQEPPPKEDPEALFKDGLKHYNLAEYEAAAELFKRAYLISGAAELLFNIGQAYRKMGAQGCKRAYESYRSYLRADPHGARKRDVESIVDDLRACAEAKTEEPTPPADAEGARRSTATAGSTGAAVSANGAAANNAPASGAAGTDAAGSGAAGPKTLTNGESPSAVSAATPQDAVRGRMRTALPLSAAALGLVLGAAGGGLLGWVHADFSAMTQSCAPTCDPMTVDALRARQNTGVGLAVAGGVVTALALTVWVLLQVSGSGESQATGTAGGASYAISF